MQELINTILWSVSPFGEAKVGIPYGIVNELNIYLVFVVAFCANVLVFPMMMIFLEKINTYFLRWHAYKKPAIWVARRAKTGSADKIQKYGFWGLIFFVMIPLPGTGVYAGSIVTYLFKIEKQKAFLANTIGIFFSSVIVWATAVLTMQGLS